MKDKILRDTAPEMLEALQRLQEVFFVYPDDWDEHTHEFCIQLIDAIIEKATGNPDPYKRWLRGDWTHAH